MKTGKGLLRLAQFSVLLAIEAIVCFTPLGSLPAIGPIVATLMMIPVVITAILLGPKAGTLMGFFAGLFSFIVWTFMPPAPAVAFLFTPFYALGEVQGNFWSLVICFVPRTLSGLTAGLCYKAFVKVFPGVKKSVIKLPVSAAVGSLTNTLLVLGGAALFFGDRLADGIYNLLKVFIGMQILTSGIPEAVVAAILAYFVCRAVSAYTGRAGSR